MFKLFSSASLYDIFGDLVILRNLQPFDPRLPGLAEAWRAMGLPSARIPRKHEPDYARASVWFVRQARALDLPATPVRELLFIGDTAMADGNAFRNLARMGGWPGWCFIGNEKLSAPAALNHEADRVTLGNRWALLADWLAAAQAAGARFDEGSAVVVDMDKTAIAARGRNAHVIDNARVEGVELTVAGSLGAAFQRERFLHAYKTLGDPIYHPFTADNQDYLAYICLAVSAGVIDLPDLVAQVQAGEMTSFVQFITWADGRMTDAHSGLQAVHSDVFPLVQAGDPTPFKAFRRNEYRRTAARFNCLPAEASVEARLADEICITAEVYHTAQWLKQRGCLLLTMSDKPDEATVPTSALAAEGWQPLHRLRTAVVGAEL